MWHAVMDLTLYMLIFSSAIPSFFIMDIEEQFRILQSYKESCLAYNGDDACPSPPPPPPNLDKCWHNHQVVSEGQYVCTACGLVLGHVLLSEVNWTDRCVKARTYSARERLNAVDKHLVCFMKRTGIQVQLHGVQERLQFAKKDNNYKSLNYAIALRCIYHEDEATCQKLRVYLPKSNVAWARSSKLMNCMPEQFAKAWLQQLMTGTRALSKAQAVRLRENLSKFKPEQVELMQRLIRCYDRTASERDLDALPNDLRCALYRFSCAIVKMQKGIK
eukprot:scpid88804/ scgid13810/ 